MVLGVFLSRTIGPEPTCEQLLQEMVFAGPDAPSAFVKKGYPHSMTKTLIFAIQLPSFVGKSWYKSSIFRQTIEVCFIADPIDLG